MGKWFARWLSEEGFTIIISGRDEAKLSSAGRELGVAAASNIEAVKKADMVLISVSIDSFEGAVKEIAPWVRPEQVIADITSIKQFPVEVMHRHLGPATVLGTHPVFGPGARNLASQNFVLTPTDEGESSVAQKVRKFLEARGARVSLMSPREHDSMMAVVLGLAHFISIVSADTLASFDNLAQMKAIGGSTYRVLTTLVESVISEDPELYAALQMQLPGLSEIEAEFQVKAGKWAEMVRKQDRQGFVADMQAVKKKFAERNSDFGQAYENMYKIMEWL